MTLDQASHLRFNPLTGEWVLVCPRRGARPHAEKDAAAPPAGDAPYDPTCYLCVGNMRAGGVRNPDYKSVYVFDNDFPALSADASGAPVDIEGLIRARPERGICRVMCYSPRHDLPPARLPLPQLRAAIDTWVAQYRELGALPWINHVQIFENHGAVSGASSNHPHSQIWASADIPNEPAAEQASQKAHAERGGCLLCDYAKLEARLGTRIVCENDGFLVVVPYWAVWPFETMVLSKRHIGAIDELTDAERDLLADILKRVSTRYDNLFRAPFPYDMAFHQSPTDGQPHPEWHFHAHYYSPMRSATAQKVMAAYELAAGRERDDLPEDAAVQLRAASDVHYLDAKA
jgi:UDPglucose--hexose-1-phosphate uridylyltransferase